MSALAQLFVQTVKGIDTIYAHLIRMYDHITVNAGLKPECKIRIKFKIIFGSKRLNHEIMLITFHEMAIYRDVISARNAALLIINGTPAGDQAYVDGQLGNLAHCLTGLAGQVVTNITCYCDW